MAAKTKDYFTRLADQIEKTLDQRADVIAEKLQPMMHSGDVTNVPKSQWYEMIAQNWNDPQWRAEKAFASGPVKFVQDALQAHGLPPSLLKDNAEGIVNGYGTRTEDANAQLMENVNTPGEDPLPKTAPPPPQPEMQAPQPATPPAPQSQLPLPLQPAGQPQLTPLGQ